MHWLLLELFLTILFKNNSFYTGNEDEGIEDDNK